MTLNTIILAAGHGTRMYSTLPKVLHPLSNKSILLHIIDAAAKLENNKIYVVYGAHGERVRTALQQAPVTWVEQSEPLGTGHAVMQVLPLLKDNERALILVGDIPLITPETLTALCEKTKADEIGVVTAEFSNPTGLGRILRNPQGQIIGVVEEKDASETQRQIKEINTGIILAPIALLKKYLPTLGKNNAQGEYYLTEIFQFAKADGIKIQSVQPNASIEVKGMNNRAELAVLERGYQQRQAETFMKQGVTLRDPARFDVRGDVCIGQDTVIDIDVILEGVVQIGARCKIGPYCYLKDVTLADDVEILSHTVMDGAVLASGARVGPFARIRPGTVIQSNAHIGNFVETKKSTIGEGTKIGHLSYIGDATLGRAVNVGAGTITCNYDGANKHATVIQDGAFIGSNTALVAPVVIGKAATVGAGSTISKDAPENTLVLTRAKQTIIANWKRPVKIEGSSD